MISEGVDIPRAACLAWLTSYRTPLFFAQAVGRVVRARRPGETATVYLPAVRPLLTLAADLESERDRVVRLRSVDDQGELDAMPGEVERLTGLNEWEAIDAEASFAHVLAGGRAVTADAAAHANQTIEDLDDGGFPGLLTPEQTAALLAKRDQELHKRLRAGRPQATVRRRDPDQVSWQDAGACAARSTRSSRGWRPPAGCRMRSCTRRSGRPCRGRRRHRRRPNCSRAGAITCWSACRAARRNQ